MPRSRPRERGWPPVPEPLPVPVVDNHTHLDSVLTFPVPVDGAEPDRGAAPAGDGERAAPRTLADHLDLAASVGVTRLVQVGCDLEAVRWTDAVLRTDAGLATDAGTPPDAGTAPDAGAATDAGTPPTTPAPRRALLGALAIHPNEAVLHAGVHELAPDGLEPDPRPWHDRSLDDALAEVAATARANPRVRAIGETGLDHFRAGSRGRQVQAEAFRAHVALAKELGLALQIHDRDAHTEVVEILLRDGAPERTVFHCFSGGAALAELCAARGWFLSFAGPVTFGANDALRDALTAVPLSQVMVETDAPYLTPHPYRGRPDAPYLVPHTVRRVAAVTGLDLATVCRVTSATAEAVYGSW